ncbi:conserved hypothetical protein [Ricinus communis]|uniref:Uncharacterized protein n=1 Tax=Ricinus communis TaxID=3988 RepID=B9TNK4_RICCO|nr:conserved hypothetical protein [Ricinus communis]
MTVALLASTPGPRRPQILAVGLAGIGALLVWSPFIPMLIRQNAAMAHLSYWIRFTPRAALSRRAARPARVRVVVETRARPFLAARVRARAADPRPCRLQLFREARVPVAPVPVARAAGDGAGGAGCRAPAVALAPARRRHRAGAVRVCGAGLLSVAHGRLARDAGAGGAREPAGRRRARVPERGADARHLLHEDGAGRRLPAGPLPRAAPAAHVHGQFRRAEHRARGRHAHPRADGRASARVADRATGEAVRPGRDRAAGAGKPLSAGEDHRRERGEHPAVRHG